MTVFHRLACAVFIGLASTASLTAAGDNSAGWRREHGQFLLDVTVPANTTAVLFLRCHAIETVIERSQPIVKANGVKFVRVEKEPAIFAVSGATYQFASPALE
jgi:alpha-L-rhamnosidase